MTGAFERLYGATALDPADRQDQIAELARRTLIDAARRTGATMQVRGGEDLPFLLGGLMVGVVQVIQATAGEGPKDEIDAAIRSSLMQMAGWAVDMARSAQGLEPLGHD